MNAEQKRLEQNAKGIERWDLWGPYLAERAWGTVREDYSAEWRRLELFSARSRPLARLSLERRWYRRHCDSKQRLCFAFAFWNERDPILKERLFGLTGPQGNHGEDVKEIYWYTDNTPTHSFMRMVYRYPQARFPYEELVARSRRALTQDREFELWDTNALESRFLRHRNRIRQSGAATTF